MNNKCNLFGHDFKSNREQNKRAAYSHSCTRCDRYTDYPNRKGEVWKDTFWDGEIWLIIKIFLYLLMAFAFLISIGFWFTNSSCNSYLEMGIPTQWNFFTGCMANHPKFGWVPIDEYFKILNISIP